MYLRMDFLSSIVEEAFTGTRKDTKHVRTHHIQTKDLLNRLDKAKTEGPDGIYKWVL